MAQSRRLGDFVVAVAAELGLDFNSSRPPFGRHGSSLLRTDAPNHVLLYPGSFNPPHRGHQALLRHVLRTAGDDMSFIAAIIVPTDDDKLAAKNIDDQRPFLLDKAKRASLWREAGLPSHLVWVFEASNVSWKSFRSRLQEVLARHGIDLTFVLLVGPECISSTAASDPGTWDCIEAITSDISRPADFRYPHSLRQLSACSMWEPCSLPRDAPSSDMTIDAAAVESRPDELPPLPVVSMWKCETLKKPLRRYRFVPAQLPGPGRREAPSSTEIRHLIATCRERQLKESLAKLAIGPSLLLRYALEGGPYSAPSVRHKALNHADRKAKADEGAVW